MDETIITFTAGAGDAGKRLDAFLGDREEDLTRSRAKHLIESGRVSIDGRVCSKVATKIKPGQVVVVAIPEPAPIEVLPQEIELNVLFEDSEMIVISKQAGLVVHPAAGNPDHTLVNALLAHCKDLSGIGGELRPGIVHRLDKDTTGVLVAAKNDRAHLSLTRQFSDRTVSKEYLAVVIGRPRLDQGVWTEPIGRHPTDRKRMSTRSHSPRSAVTHYRLLAFDRGVGALALKIDTGRTHQIRVHCSAAGCPVAHDELYNGLRRMNSVLDPELKKLLTTLGRPALHSYRLRLAHPDSGEPMEFIAPPDPALQALFDAIGARYE